MQIFATDLSDPTALDKARAGIYPETHRSRALARALRRFFRKDDHVYRIEKSIRDLCVFARQNIAADPPFSHMDLISCRNVLIYMSPALQRQVLPMFHYALEIPGIPRPRLLGDGGTEPRSVRPRRPHPPRLHQEAGRHATCPSLRSATHHAADTGRGATAAERRLDAGQLPEGGRSAVVGRDVPPGVLVNQDFEILQFRAETGAYLQPPPGEPTLGLLKMAREGLFTELRNALLDAKRTNQPVVRAGRPRHRS